MRPDSPACFECPKATGGMHRWQVRDGLAECVNCKIVLSKADSADLYWNNTK